MKKTNEEILQFYGLKVGDKVRVEDYATYFVIVIEDGEICAEEVYENYVNLWGFPNFASMLIAGYGYEIITAKKKIGEMKCDEMLCRKCPLRAIDCDAKGKTLYEDLENYKKYLNSFNGSLKPFEKALIGVIKAELDKEVEECEK